MRKRGKPASTLGPRDKAACSVGEVEPATIRARSLGLLSCNFERVRYENAPNAAYQAAMFMQLRDSGKAARLRRKEHLAR